MPRDKGLKTKPARQGFVTEGGGGPRQHGVLTHGHIYIYIHKHDHHGRILADGSAASGQALELASAVQFCTTTIES